MAGPTPQKDPKSHDFGEVYHHSYNNETLSGAKTLESGDKMYQILDPDGAARDVNLPADAQGERFRVVNTAGAANALTVKDSDGNTVHSVGQDEAAEFVNYGSGWVAFAGATASGSQDQ